MFFFGHKASLSRFLLNSMIGFMFLINSQLNAEQPDKETDPAAQNWYQVEVILFDQKNTIGNESAPKDLQINFSQNWLELSDKYPSVGIMRRPIFDPSSTATIKQPEHGSLGQILSELLGIDQNPVKNYNDGSRLIPEASIPYQYQDTESFDQAESTALDQLKIPTDMEVPADNEASEPIDTENIADFKPVYEQPYQILEKKFRDLNDTARALDRRKYKVRFHQAWRFQIDSKQESPWILVKTEPELANRQVIEGALRFYKSRYLHFETDLWRINFSTAENTQIDLPQIPQKQLNDDEKSLLKALRFSKKLMLLTDDLPKLKNFSVSESNQEFKGIKDVLAGYDLSEIATLLDSPRDTTAGLTKVDIEQGYPIKEIWPIKQSKRIQENEVYYIDHPYMGALVTVKSYQPIAINSPPQITQQEEFANPNIAE